MSHDLLFATLLTQAIPGLHFVTFSTGLVLMFIASGVMALWTETVTGCVALAAMITAFGAWGALKGLLRIRAARRSAQ